VSDNGSGVDAYSLLQFLQHGDSQFPSGSFAFSAGLEGLFADDRIDPVEGLQQFVEGQLRHRWVSLDRVGLVRTYRLGEDLDAVAALDREIESMSLAEGLREGSSRNGNAMLNMHARMQTPLAADYRALISAGRAPGHIPIVQGLVWGQSGLSESQAEAAAAHNVCTDLLGAAMRLGKVGHVDVQKIRNYLNLVIMKLLDDPVDSTTGMHTFVAAAEIAAMRHETSELRLFAT